MVSVHELFAVAALVMETVGVAIIVLGSAYVVLREPWRRGRPDRYGEFRRDLGRAIILGLEFLIAGDIIRTVAVSHSLEGVGVLAVIVLIRSLLSIALGFEIEGRWPPRRPDASGR